MKRQYGTTAFLRAGLICALTAGMPVLSMAQSSGEVFIDRSNVSRADGETIFTHVCQACHMPDGRGAHGAGSYPALARNPKLASAAYPAAMILSGRGDMPEFGPSFSDEQIAAVVNYVRTHFGNDYHDPISAADVKAMRPKP
jgi:mono/diheme cytochrome c family protein